MDADCKERRRGPDLSQKRKEQWAMDPVRLEEILADLRKALVDINWGFENASISATLEEPMTKVVEIALETNTPLNFAELGILLQHSVNVYGKKVDYLYQNVIDMCDSLQHSTLDCDGDGDRQDDEPATPSGVRRRRKTSACAGAGGDFAHISLESSASARRGPEAPRPPPTLPRMYIELEPRVLTAADAPLLDYDGEPVGLPADFHVTWRLQDGLLVDELERGSCGGGAALRPIDLVELQAAIEAAAPPSPPPRASTPFFSPVDLEPKPETPPPSPPPPLTALTPIMPPPVRNERKRHNTAKIDDVIGGSFKFFVSAELRQRLGAAREFDAARAWCGGVVRRRAGDILAARRDLKLTRKDFRGFDVMPDLGGFVGWSSAEALSARASALNTSARVTEMESDDDGFFEQSSSFSGSDSSRLELSLSPLDAHRPVTIDDAAAWQARVVSRAAAAEAKGVDVRALGGAVLRACAGAALPLPFDALLQREATGDSDVSRLLLATLFLANSGNVEIEQGGPLTVNSLSLTLLSSDERLYTAVVENDDELL